ncbi:hypothetical protein [Agaribacter marinus]|uniref:Uncharacterized protein n=1 Tax=Agaribacter marinus TaxID=1431249 RepID=A0AA37WJJ0_9ALTE|nr:hypothetical protein [Agaribacter marinus]GLR70279.1 hypothetical protein GCM10007852_11870 [Agaribacter marinus]
MRELNMNEMSDVMGGVRAAVAISVLGYIGGRIANSVESYIKNRERTESSGGQMNQGRRLSQ